MLYAFMVHHSHLADPQSIELSKSMAIFVFQYKAKQTSYACVQLSHSVLVTEMKHFYLLNDASSIFSNWHIWIAKLNRAPRRLRLTALLIHKWEEKVACFHILERCIVHYNSARCLEMGIVGQGREPYINLICCAGTTAWNELYIICGAKLLILQWQRGAQ